MSEDSGQVDVARVPDLENPNFELNDHSIALFHVRGPFFFFFFYKFWLQWIAALLSVNHLEHARSLCPQFIPLHVQIISHYFGSNSGCKHGLGLMIYFCFLFYFLFSIVVFY